MDILSALQKEIIDPYDDFFARLLSIGYEWDESDLNTDGRFFYLPFVESRCTQKEFVDVCYGSMETLN